MADDTNGKAEEPEMVHGSREHAERTDIQMFSVLHTPLLLMEARECPGCVGYGQSTRYFASQVGKEQLRTARGTRTRAEQQPGSSLNGPAPRTSDPFCGSILQHPLGAESFSAQFLKNHKRKEVLEQERGTISSI